MTLLCYLRVHFLPRIVGPAFQLTRGELLQVLAAGEALCAALTGAGEVCSASLRSRGAVHNLRSTGESCQSYSGMSHSPHR